MTKAEIDALVARHGGMTSDAVAVDPVIDNPNPNKLPSDPDKVANPNPTYRYILKDGTTFEARGTPGKEDGDFQITNPGTALKPEDPGTKKPSDINDWKPIVDPNDPKHKGLQDPVTGNIIWSPAQTPGQAKPADLKDWKPVTDPNDPTRRGIQDPNTGQIIWTPTPSPGQTKPAPFGDWKPITDPNDPTRKGLQDPNTGQVTWTPKSDAKATPAPFPDWTPITDPNDPEHKGVQDPNTGNIIWTPKAAEKASTVFNDPNSKWIIWYDDKGTELGRAEKPDFQPQPKFQAGQGPAADLIAAKVPTINPQTGALEFIDNPNQVKASQAVSDLAAKLGLQVAAGSMSEKQAQDLITGAVNTMNAQSAATNAATAQAAQQATTANDVLTNVQNAAQTGAGVLQNRVTNAQGMLQGVLGLANGGQRSGNMGGGLMSAPAGLGENLVQGIQGWATELGGGPDVYTSAANLVRRADPQSALGQDAGAAYGALGQMLQKYRELTGQPHPAETIANQQQQRTGGVTTPVTAAAQPSGSGVAVPTTPVVSHGGVGPWAGGQTPAPGTTYYDPNYNPQTGGFTAPPPQQPKVTVSIG